MIDRSIVFHGGEIMRSYVLIAALAAGFATAALGDDAPKPQAQQIAKAVWLIPGGILPDRQPDGNTVIFAAPKGLIVMDTGRHLWHREAIKAFARDQHRDIAAIVNSHWHLDHVSGNPDLKRAYPNAKVYASNAIRGALTGFLARSAAEAKPYLQDKTIPAATREDIANDIATYEAGNLLLPDVVIDKSAKRAIAGKSLQVNLAPNAATDGDVWLFDAASGVAAVGDLVTLPAPFLDTACSAGWSKALAQVSATAFKTVLPGHGAPMTRKDFSTYRTAFDGLITCSASSRDAKDCAAEWASNVSTLIGSDDAVVKQAKGMAGYYVGDVLRKHNGNSADCKA